MAYDPIAVRRADLERQIRDAQRALDTIQMVPVEDTYPDGAIIRAQIRSRSGESATYVFLKVIRPVDIPRDGDVVRWYHTGQIDHGATQQRARGEAYFVSWRELQSWLIDRGRVIESWEIVEPRCELDHTPRNRRAHEDIQADILNVLRSEYGAWTDIQESKHERVIAKIMNIEGVYK